MNATFGEIKKLFESEKIEDFASLPEDPGARGRFAALFKQFNDYMVGAKIQGFVWKQAAYSFKQDGADDTLVTMDLDERVFAILGQRYKELSSGGGGGASS